MWEAYRVFCLRSSGSKIKSLLSWD